MLTDFAPQRQATDAWSSRLQLLLESTGEGIYGIDTEGRRTFINRAAAGMLGLARENVFGLNMHQLMHHSHADGRHYGEEDWRRRRRPKSIPATPACSAWPEQSIN